MSDAMHGIEKDVEFDFGAARSLIAACTSAATQVGTERSSHSGWVRTAMTDFKGYFSRLFESNGETADRDATELARALSDTATAVTKLETDARAEQKRRNDARAWKKEHDDRSTMDKVGDFLSGGDDCPIPDPAKQMSYSPDPPSQTARHTPGPGSFGGADSGTSSARPSDLHSFATSMNAAHTSLSTKKGSVRAAYSAFVADLGWGSLDASGVIAGFEAWLQANHNDALWAKSVGDAFASAGGEGAVSSLPNSSIDAALKAAGVSEVRKDLTIDMPSAIGSPPTTGYANDPVNTSTGNFVETESDLEFGAASADLWWRRSYNSLNSGDASTVSGAFGPGWSTWCETGLVLDDEAAAFTLPDGRVITFPRLGAGWDRASGESLWLTREETARGERLVVTGNDGARWVHTPAGRLLSAGHGAGTEVTLDWAADRLVGLTHARGRGISLEWSGPEASARVVALRASDGRRIGFTYDEQGRLVAAAGPLGTRRYAWNAAGLIESVTDADGVVEVANSYDEQGRVVRQRSPFGRVTRFAYLPGRVTVVSDDDGTRANTWIADEKGRLTGVIDAHDKRQSMAYDAHGNKVMVTGRDGAVTINEYDERGRQARRVLASGADISYTHDELDRVVRVEVAGGSETAVTTLTYVDDQRDPSTVTDPEGGVTRMTWTDGLLTRLVDPTGIAVEIGYDAHGEVVSATDPLGGTGSVERDKTGRILATVRPGGERTTYAYAPGTGLVTSRTDPDGATWHYEHTGAGRLHAVVDPTGGRTELERDETGEESATIDPLGRAVRRSYDDLGNLAGTTLPDGSRWEFVHDALGRLTRVVDPEGGVAGAEYDVTGDLRAVVDPTGVRTETVPERTPEGESLELVDGEQRTRLDVDRLGRLVSETGSDGTTRLTRYDLCGRAVEVVDAVGGLTRLVRDAAGRVTTTVKPSGAEISYAYDGAGRLETVTDETGALTRLVRDAEGRVVAQHLPTGEVGEVRYDACGRVVAQRIPGVGTITCGYDAAGRMVDKRDPRSGRRRFGYDAAGQLVSATDGNGATTTYAYDDNGRCTATTRPDGGVTRREYDANDRPVAETDPLGRRTTAEYDAAGRQVAQTDPAGSRTEWRYDADGRLASTWVDGVEQSSVERDLPGRRVRITDRSGPGGSVAVHELTWDARGLLVARTRDGSGPSWSYDADGHRTALMGPDGTRTSYARDAAGRLLGISHPLLGTAVVERDAAGRMVSATAGGTVQRWTYADGFLTAYALGGLGGSRRTRVERDQDDRIVSLSQDGATTAYSYDEAYQLIGAATTTASGEQTARWRYDAAGRLVGESADGVSRELAYDLAGQLTAIRVHGEEVTAYSYDAVGRRTREDHADGSSRAYAWGPGGWLSAITVTDRLGDTRRTDVVVDALGELARISDGVSQQEVFADSADPWGGLLSVGGEQVVRGAGFTGRTDGTHGTWAGHGWREARRTGGDPWSLPAGLGAPVGAHAGPHAGASLTDTGELLVAGLEWMGERLYDPSTRAFLSVDPLLPTVGAAWAGNPYAYAGNDPLHALDPLGLHPVTDQELKDYNSNNGIGGFVKNNWEYGLAALAVGAGVLCVATGFGGPLGMMLISGGVDIAAQKITTGKVNWGEVAVSVAAGGLGAGAGSYIAKTGLTGARALAANVGANAAIGGIQNGGTYVAQNWGHVSVRGLAGSTAGGMVTGAAMGGSDAAGMAASRNLSGVTGRVVTHSTAALIDGAGGAGGSAVDQVISTGHVDGGDVARGAGGAAAGGRGAAVVKHYVGEPEAPYHSRHRVGPQHRSDTTLDYEPRSAGADVPLGTVFGSILGG